MDLDDAYAYVAHDKPPAAKKLIEQIEDGVAQLSVHPMLGRVGRVPETRELVIAGTPFLVIYRVDPRRVIVLTVLHAARRWPRSQP